MVIREIILVERTTFRKCGKNTAHGLQSLSCFFEKMRGVHKNIGVQKNSVKYGFQHFVPLLAN
jgi:hypothetical protein